MNRHITEPASNLLNQSQANEYSHRYTMGLYSILNTITTLFPEVLFENCSSGGGRLDAGMLYFMPQTWASEFYRLESPFDSNHCAWMFTDKARNKIIVYLFRNIYDVSELSLLVKIPFIDLSADYMKINSHMKYSGSELATCGIASPNPIGDFLAIRLDFKKC